ncbi:MAG TPA: DUF4214 domain-containing protein [Burkholderiaceae bacterium]
MQLLQSAAACSLAALILAACGGNNSGSDTAQTDQQAQQLSRQAKSASVSYQTAVESLYVAYFGRPADPTGLANFAVALQAAGAPADVAGLANAYASNAAVKSLIDSFGTSAESQKLYGGGDTAAFVTAVFQDVLGRAPLPAGISFWVGAIDSGKVSQGDAALSIMAGALANTSAQGLLDAQLVDNRLAAAGYFTGAASPATYSGAAAAANARAMLATINAATAASALQGIAVTDAQAYNNQTLFESIALHGGEWYVYDNIPYGGGVLVPGKNYLYSQVIDDIANSPATGAQLATTRFTTLDSALSPPASSASRVLVDGQVLLRPVAGLRSISYVGNGIQVQYYDSTGQTVVSTSHFDNYKSAPLSGQMAQSAEILQASVPLNLWVGYQNFSASASWQNGSAYVSHSAHGVGDLYALSDCTNVASPTYTTGIAPTPCLSNTALTAAVFPIALYSGDIEKPYEIDNAGDGRFVTVQGLPMWIANNPRPLEEAGSAIYRFYVQMNGSIYMGSLSKDGTAIYTRQADGTFVDTTLALNETAANSISQGLITGSSQGSKAGSGTAVSDTADMFGIGGTGINGALSPNDIRAHYNVPATLTGAGQTVAIVDAPGGGDVEADLAAYSAYYNLPPCTTTNGCLTQHTFAPAAGYTGSWGAEPDLDVQMVHAVAPAAKILLVTAASNSGADLSAAVDYAFSQPGVTAVSMSFGGGLNSQATSDFFNAATGGGAVAFASSGDDGYAVSPSLPAADPWVVAVGGTRVNAVRPGAGDWGWQFSGGGTYIYFQANSWMAAVQPQTVMGGKRGVPDVSAVADFQNSAVSVYYADRWVLGGGTSASSPIWAGFAALFGESVGANNQTLLSKLGAPSGGFSQILYQMAASGNAAGLFHQATAGSNDAIGAYCQLCTATGTYNEVTGLGSPDVANMMAYLGGKAPAVAAVSAVDSQRLGQPAYRMTRAMLRTRLEAWRAKQALKQGH